MDKKKTPSPKATSGKKPSGKQEKAKANWLPDDFNWFDDSVAPPKTSRSAASKTASKKAQKPTKKQRNDWWAMPVSLVLLCLLAAMGYLATNSVGRYANFREMRMLVERQTFYPGITIDGEDVSDYTKNQALSKWAAKDAEQNNRYSATLSIDGQTWHLTAADMGYQNNYRQVIESAWAVGRYGTLEERYNAVRTAGDGKTRAYQVQVSADKMALKEKTDAIADELSVAPVNAKIKAFDPSTLSFVYTEAKPGLMVDKDKLLKSVTQAINQNTHDVAIVRETIYPARTPNELSEIYGEISTATTNASSSTNNRLTNIDLALKALDGHMIKPGETFSFNDVVGQRTKGKGYKAAGAIENGILTDQIGGGICQVSTTLFNAVAKADLEIVERSPHSRPSTYVDKGKDAAVDWPNQDFKFKNNSVNPIYISARLDNEKRVTVKMFGEKLKNGMTISIEAKTTSTVKPGADRYIKDSSLAPGEQVLVEKARNGYKAEAYRVYIDSSGNEIRRELLCKSTYAASGTVYKVGG